ncbi:MAG: phosphopyruvate hydratase, partial [bacterium]|nr:phosphopyruvate hydratase [bacterium]
YYFSDQSVSFPRLMVNLINGGKHANWNFDFQEYILTPKDKTPSASVRMASSVFHSMQKLLKSRNLSPLVGDEGGFSPELESNMAAFDLIISAASELEYKNSIDFDLGMDVAASEFYNDGIYELKKDNLTLDASQQMEYYSNLRAKYSVYSIEDPFEQDEWESFSLLNKSSEGNFLVVGDDLTVTNTDRIRQGIEHKSANAIIIKVNQIGSLIETVEAIKLARSAGWKIIISHRSGETEDSFIADLAYGSGADFIKTGSMSRSDRICKYNRLLEIEHNI